MNALFEAIWRASAFGLAALAVALGATWLLNGRAPAAWRAWIWRIALLQSVFALLPLAPVQWKILAPPDAATPRVITAPLAQSNESPVIENAPPLEIPAVPLIESAPPMPITEQPTPAPAPLDWRTLALAIYGLGLMFQFAQLARGKRQLQRILHACVPAENAIITARLQTLATRMQLKTAPQLLMSSGGSPFLTGVWRPQIVLPRAWCDAEIAQLDAVLAHELAHCKRRDLLWLGATWLGQTLLWFHPLSWVSRRFHGLETECACDELALQLAPIAPQSYGALLLNSMNNSKFSSPLAAGTCDTLFALKTRLLRLNNAPKTPHRTAKFAFVLALLLSCGALVPLKLVARAGDAPEILGESQSWPTGRITEPQYDARAVVQGIVISRTTKKPLAGVPIILIAPYHLKEKIIDFTRPPILRYQGTVTDARGYYRFNTIGGGLHSLGIAGIVFDDPKSSGFSAELLYDFNLKNGRMRNFTTAIDEDFARPNRAKSMIQISEVAGRGNAVVQGVVKSKQTQKPLAGVPMILAYGKSSQQSVTDARGYFHFNARAGRYVLKAKNGEPLQTFDLAKGQKREFDLVLGELPPRDVADIAATPSASKNAGSAVAQNKKNASPNKITTGTVVGPNGEPVANAIVQASTMNKSRGGSLLSVICDKNGRFQLSAEMSKATVQLWADAGELTTPQSTFVGAGGHVKLQMEKNAWLSVSGRITDDKRQSLQGAKVRAHFLLGNLMSTERIVESDANGRFIFDHVRPGSKFFLTSTLAGYGAANYSANKNEKFADFAMIMPSANTSLRGVVTDEKGQPAKSFTLFVRSEQYSTDANGKFFLPHVVEGKNEISVMAPDNRVMWKPIEVKGGDQNVKIRLTTATRESGYGVTAEYKPNLDQRRLLGKMAPPIQASYWSNNKAIPLSSLRGKVVLLVFNGFDYNPNRAIADFARSFAGRVQVIGILPDFKSRSQTRTQIDATAKQYSFPIALDSPPQNQLGRPTLAAYNSASYAVIGRDGKIIYAGDELRSALQIASR